MEGITSLETAQQVGQRLIDLKMISEIEGKVTQCSNTHSMIAEWN